MSLINDALKRAGQGSPPPPPLPGSAPPLQPVLYAPPSKLPLVLVPLLFLAMLGLGVWFLFKGFELASHLYSKKPVLTVAARQPTPVQPPAIPSNSTPPIGSSAGNAPHPTGQQIIPAPASATSVAEPGNPPVQPAPPSAASLSAPAAASFPELRLQALFYRLSNPSVMINGKTLFVGETIAGAKVIAISQETVLLEWRGQTKELRPP